MTPLTKTAVPQIDFRVRRRRYGDARWLVQQNDWYEVDAITDTIWGACEAQLSVEEIIKRVMEAHELTLTEALADTSLTLARFESLGLITWNSGD